MAKPDRRADLDQSGRLGGRRRVRSDAESLDCTPEQDCTSPTGSAAAVRRSRRVSSGSGASRRRKPCFDAAGQWHRASCTPNPNASSAGVSPLGQLQQCQRIAVRLGDDPFTDPLHPLGPLMTVSNNVRASLSLSPLTLSSGSRDNSIPRRARAPQTPVRRVPPAAGARRTPASGPRLGRAIAHHRRGRPVVAPQRPPTSD